MPTAYLYFKRPVDGQFEYSYWDIRGRREQIVFRSHEEAEMYASQKHADYSSHQSLSPVRS